MRQIGELLEEALAVPTNRVRRRRQLRLNTAITTEAIQLYRRARELQREGWEHSREYCETVFALNVELRVKPWLPSLLHPLGDRPPREVPRELQHYWHAALALQRALDRAVATSTEPLPPSDRVVTLRTEASL